MGEGPSDEFEVQVRNLGHRLRGKGGESWVTGWTYWLDLLDGPSGLSRPAPDKHLTPNPGFSIANSTHSSGKLDDR